MENKHVGHDVIKCVVCGNLFILGRFHLCMNPIKIPEDKNMGLYQDAADQASALQGTLQQIENAWNEEYGTKGPSSMQLSINNVRKVKESLLTLIDLKKAQTK